MLLHIHTAKPQSTHGLIVDGSKTLVVRRSEIVRGSEIVRRLEIEKRCLEYAGAVHVDAKSVRNGLPNLYRSDAPHLASSCASSFPLLIDAVLQP
eukprot:IDg3381t1